MIQQEMKHPKWIMEIVENVCKNSPRKPFIKRTKRHGANSSSGVFYNTANVIKIRVGTEAPRWEQKMVLLHELAHWLNPNESHTTKFWETAFSLYKEYKLPIRKCHKREKGYRKEATNVYRKIKGLKQIKKKRTKRIKSTLHQLMKTGFYIQGVGQICSLKGKYWAITNMNECKTKTRGFVITEKLYKLLINKGYKDLTQSKDFELPY